MKIDSATIGLDSGQPAVRSDAVYGQQWRKALEEAQWQARQRIAPQADNPHAEVAAAAAPAGRAIGSAGAFLVPQADPGNAAPVSPDIAGRSRALEAALQGTNGASRAPAGAASSGIAPGSPTLLVAGAAGATDAPAARAAVEPVLLQWTELPEWPAVVVHASLSGNRLSIGIRDRALQERDALDLYYRLRAELGAVGLALANLTVNGQRVLAPDDAATPT